MNITPARLLGRPITDEDLRPSGNILTIVRLILAASVIFSHAFLLTRFPDTHFIDPSLAVLPFSVSRLAVFLFFTLSGFLVSASLIHRGAGEFLLARAVRVVPGLYVMLFVTTLLLGLVAGDLPFGDYLRSASVRAFLGHHLLLRNGVTDLAGVFTHNPSTSVNVSIWTIPYEVKCYLLLVLAGVAGVLRHRRILLAAITVTVVVNVAIDADYESFLKTLPTMAVAFAIGVAMFVWRDRLRLSWPIALAGVALTLVLPTGRVTASIAQFTFGYAALVASICVPAAWKRWSARRSDYSYGIYIYAFPAQQAAIALGIGTTPYANMATGFAIALPFAIASWHFIEKPALSLKPVVSRRAAAWHAAYRRREPFARRAGARLFERFRRAGRSGEQ